MILKEEYLIKRNNKNRVQVALVQLDEHPLTGMCTIYKTIFQFNGKKRELPNTYINYGRFEMDTKEYGAYVLQAECNRYISIGYTPLSKVTNKKFSSFENEADLLALLDKNDKKAASSLPLPMLPKSYDQCSPDIIEKDCYCTVNVDGIRCMIYYTGGKVCISTREYENINCTVVKDPALCSLFQVMPDIVLDCFLYKYGWSLEQILNDAIHNEGANLQLWIYDYVDKAMFTDRVKQLESFKELLEPNSNRIKVANYVKVAGWLKIQKIYNNAVKEGYSGLLIKFPPRPYGSGKKSAFYMINLLQVKTAPFEITKIEQEGFTIKDLTFTIITPAGKSFKVRANGDDDLLTDWLTNKNNYIGKKITCMFEYYTKDGIPVNPAFKCFN